MLVQDTQSCQIFFNHVTVNNDITQFNMFTWYKLHNILPFICCLFTLARQTQSHTYLYFRCWLVCRPNHLRREKDNWKSVFFFFLPLPAVSLRLKILPHIPLFIHLFSSFGGSFITLHYLLSSAGESDSLIWNQAASMFGTRFWAQVNFKNAPGNSIRDPLFVHKQSEACDLWFLMPRSICKGETEGGGAQRRSRGCVGVCFVFIFEICSPTILLGVPNTVARQH